MTDTQKNFSSGTLLMSDTPEDWGPPEAPLDMPCQDLAPRMWRFDLFSVVRQFLPRQNV
ncbi:hypothetical protein [Maritimibacter dapengensis]|uniref:Transposase n=1 Tax=Maritimibacter dapengensis TaxID=2836868 RepID=A0ABS6SZ38_9RHOB|nr:hypothetical protein [Maritimibacter dapengensis]MBV7377626.1 hypothetical protein [Maritimibacter dapengensis]